MDVKERLDSGIAFQQRGALAQAEQVYRDIIAADNRTADAWHLLAIVLAMQQRYNEASTAAEQATALAAGIPSYWLTRGKIEAARGERQHAHASYEHALRLQPGFAEAWYQLGINHVLDGRTPESIKAYREALRMAPDVAIIHYQLADSLAQEDDWAGAVRAYEQAFALDPQCRLDRRPFIDYLRCARFDTLPEFWRSEIARFFARGDVDKTLYADVGVRVLKSDVRFREAIDVSRSPVIQNIAALKPVISDALFQLLLRDAVIYDAALELFLTHLRKALLFDVAKRAQMSLDFVCALALQCFNNEYVYFEDIPETPAVEALAASLDSAIGGGSVLQDAHWRDMAVLAMYRPLAKLSGIDSLLGRRDMPKPLQPLLERLVAEVREETELRASIPAIGTINDDVSRAVRTQYEEHPYPRWTHTDRAPPGKVADWLDDELPAKGKSVQCPEVTRILVAGCGTGQEPITLAAELTDASVLAVDLSLASLAYARRKARQLGVSNVRFCQADILELDNLQEEFDIVICSGVLHHMRDPAAGLQQLVRRLRPNGFLKLALYSARARERVSEARNRIRESCIAADEPSIRSFRRHLFGLDHNDPLKPLLTYRDFFALSTCRDLLFHVQEHQYRLPGMLALLRNAGLEPLGMAAVPFLWQQAFRQQFPDSNVSADFERWDAFEALHPQTFLGMYHVWSRLARPAAS